MITYYEQDPRREGRAQMGAGQTHHFALSVPDLETQAAWREKLLGAGVAVSPVRDRVYFQSIYTHDPDGHIVELATAGPGFMADEPLESLGRRLQLAPGQEDRRAALEQKLSPLYISEWPSETP